METVAIPINAATLGLGLILIGNIGALIWGAAKLSTKLAALASTVERLSNVVIEVERRQYEHASRLSLIEQDIERTLRKLEKAGG